MVNLKGRDLLKMSDLTTEEVFYLLDLAADLKDKKKNGISVADHHTGKNIALIFVSHGMKDLAASIIVAII